MIRSSLCISALLLFAAGASSSDSVCSSGSGSSTPLVAYVLQHVFAERPADRPPSVENFLDWYESGVRAYLANDWSRCVQHMQLSIDGFRDYYQATASCRLRCERIGRDAMRAGEPLADVELLDDLPHYESLVRRTLCLVRCKQLLLPGYDEFFELGDWWRDMYRRRKPYAYLQLCLFRTGDLLGAAHATFTALLPNAGDTMMEQNLRFYLDKLRLADEHQLHDLEQRSFARAYLQALQAYAAGQFAETIDRMEESLTLFAYDRDVCRAFCDGPYEQGWNADFATATSNHFTYNLRCKLNCTDEMGSVRGRHYENIFASHYEYLHISYHNLNQTMKACRAAASYLRVHPHSELMRQNLDFYERYTQSVCAPRPEAKRYAVQHDREERLFAFILREFSDRSVRISDRVVQRIKRNATLIDEALLGRS